MSAGVSKNKLKIINQLGNLMSGTCQRFSGRQWHLFAGQQTQSHYILEKFKENEVRGSLNKFPDFFRMGIFIDSTHMKL